MQAFGRPVPFAGIPIRQIDRAPLFFIPEVEIVSAKTALRFGVAEAGLELLPNFGDFKKAAIFPQAGIGFDPCFLVTPVVGFVCGIDTPVEAGILDHAFPDAHRLLVQAPGQR